MSNKHGLCRFQKKNKQYQVLAGVMTVIMVRINRHQSCFFNSCPAEEKSDKGSTLYVRLS